MTLVKMAVPLNVDEASNEMLLERYTPSEKAEALAEAPEIRTAAVEYPVVSKPPALPSLIRGLPGFAAQDTPSSITVTRFAQDGMPVKSMAVPEVEATAVPSVSGLVDVSPVICAAGIADTLVSTVPVSSGSVRVRLVLLLGLAIENTPVPEALGSNAILLISDHHVSCAGGYC